ncbi:MAG TPA: hypothetical protein DCQ83_02285 [Fibrobacteres bacterium]|nr:hypothetical protein [Fibrobacterota bacterium]
MQLSDHQVKSLELHDAEILSIENKDGDVELEIESGGKQGHPGNGRLVFVAAYVVEPESNDMIGSKLDNVFFKRNGHNVRGKIVKTDFLSEEDEKQAHITFAKSEEGRGEEELFSLNIKYLEVKWIG